MPHISIVIGTLNRPDVVLPLLKQLEQHAKKILMEVMVVDQSLPEQYQQLQKKIPKKAIFSLVHFNIPNTCQYLNLGLREAKAPIVLYLDDDVSISQDAIKAHIEAYQHKSIMGVAGRVINNGEIINRNEKRVGKILWYGAVFIKNFSYTKETYVDFPYGCNMSFRKTALEEIGGFDETLAPPIYAFNEVDVGYRIHKRWKNSLVFKPNALVNHHQSKQGGTRDNFSNRDIFYSNQFNYGYFLGKNFSWKQNMLCFIRRSIYQLMYEPNAIPAILKGFVYAKKHA